MSVVGLRWSLGGGGGVVVLRQGWGSSGGNIWCYSGVIVGIIEIYWVLIERGVLMGHDCAGRIVCDLILTDCDFCILVTGACFPRFLLEYLSSSDELNIIIIYIITYLYKHHSFNYLSTYIVNKQIEV